MNEEGEIDWEIVIDPYGNRVREENPNKMYQPIRMQGQHFDAENNLHYNRHRYYDPKQGRYISQDPIGLEGGINNYLYPLNPNQMIDPLGLNPAFVWIGRGAWIGARHGARGLSNQVGYGVRVASGDITLDGSIMTEKRIAKAEAMTQARVKSCTITTTNNTGDDDPCDEKLDDNFVKRDLKLDPHEIKGFELPGRSRGSLFNLCGCKDGRIVIKRGNCKGRDEPIDTGEFWK